MCFFFLFLVVFNSFLTTPVQIENVRLKFGVVIPTGAPMTVENDTTEVLPVVVDKTINYLSK